MHRKSQKAIAKCDWGGGARCSHHPFLWGNIMISKVTENEQEILRLWENGMSGKDIAARIGVTRNAVMGKLHRLRERHVLTYRNVATRMAAIKRSVKEKERARIAKETGPDAKLKEQPLLETVEELLPMILEELRPKYAERKPVKFIDLDSSSCRYVISGDFAKDFLFCNEVKKIGSSYCEEHHAKCNTPNLLIRRKEKKQ